MRKEIEDSLRRVVDPEVQINIVDLGLVYGVEEDGEGQVKVLLTMTTPLCPFAPTIVKNVCDELQKLGDVESVEVEMVWEPPWSQEKMSQEARLRLGIIDGDERMEDGKRAQP